MKDYRIPEEFSFYQLEVLKRASLAVHSGTVEFEQAAIQVQPEKSEDHQLAPATPSETEAADRAWRDRDRKGV